jgi:DNA replication and repair protein RecF
MEFLYKLLPIFQYYYDFISLGNEKVELRYQSQAVGGDLGGLMIEARERDRALQFSTVGIHKDDLVLELSGFPIKQQGSQGQQKTYLVALKLAQYDFLREISGVQPLFLLDDVFDKLDADRVTQLIKLVSEDKFGQIFITDTNLPHLESILSRIPVDHRLFSVTAGKVGNL